MSSGLLVANLRSDVDELCALLEEAIRLEAWLDAYLVAVGINQVLEDAIHMAPYPLDDAGVFLGESSSGLARLGGRAAVAGGTAVRALGALGPSMRHTIESQRRLARVVDELAGVIAAGQAPSGLDPDCTELVGALRSLPPAVRRTIMRLPACFHAFDQRPEDFRRLAARFSARWADRALPVLVVGLRTSGSYMAPLVAAFLRADAYVDVDVLTLRPGQALLRAERGRLRSLVHARGIAVVVDDPPDTGWSFERAATSLEHCGVDRSQIVLMYALIGERESCEAIAERQAVTLERNLWSIEDSLRPATVQERLSALLGEWLVVDAAEELPGVRRSGRGHLRRLWLVHGRDAGTLAARELRVAVEGVGLGYLGGQALAMARALHPFSLKVFGLSDGLLYREWLPEERRLEIAGQGADRLATAAARYVAARRRAFPLARDPSNGLRGERPGWEVVALVLGDRFGRASLLARATLLEGAARCLLQVDRPCVVDGAVEPDRWFAGQAEEPAIKAGLTDHTHRRLGPVSFDPVSDLAAVGAIWPDPSLARRLLHAWEAETGEVVSEERWLLHALSHAWGVQRAEPDREAEVRHAAARIMQQYFAAVFLCGLPASGDGPPCALDVDGVLESEVAGWAGLTRASATSLRALIAHGYRPLLVTGRGSVEVRDRCRAYGLDGGVAEYGSAIYVASDDRTVPLLDEAATTAVHALRGWLQSRADVHVDPASTHAVRAYRLGSDQQRRPLADEIVASAVSAPGVCGAVRAIAGAGQTDFVPVGVDKGVGLHALARALGFDIDQVALAVGDSFPDEPMLQLVHNAWLPAHAPVGLGRGAARRAAKPYQRGLALAVADLIGHYPGGCSGCRLPATAGERTLVLSMLSVGENGRRGLAGDTLRILRDWMRIRVE